MSTHHFHDLGTVIDDVHALFDAWAECGALRSALDPDGEIVLRLAVHEWIANLVQHAAFVERDPEISVTVAVDDDDVRVEIEDTSQGFDLLGQLEAQTAILDAPAPSERGRGLLMLITCTRGLDYRPAGADRQRLSFRLTNPGDAVFAGLFRPADLEIDEFPPNGDGALSVPQPPSSR